MKKLGLIIGVVAILLIGIWLIGGNKKATGFDTFNIDDVTVYKSSTCGCCGLYVGYLNSKIKVKVNVVDSLNVDAVKRDKGVPISLQSCHTTVIDDYFIEGHIPLEAINKLLQEKPDIKGIAMPGMPTGSPGMPGAKTGDFVIYAVNKDGSYDEFMRI